MEKNMKGSLTVEAALIMPPMLAILIFFLFWFQILTTEIHIESAATEVMERSASCGYLIKYAEKWENDATDIGKLAAMFPKVEELLRLSVGNAWFSNEVREKLSGDSVVEHTVSGGVSGISFWNSTPYAEDEMSVLHIRYRVVFPVFEKVLPAVDFEKQWMMRSFSGQGEIEAVFAADTGSEQENIEDEEENYVYVTRTGSVYHASRSCSYIHVEVSACSGKELEALRNESGAKYYACEACGSTVNPNSGYWVTRTGTRFHTKKSCSKIHRDVTAILISQATAYRPCSKCAAKQTK